MILSFTINNDSLTVDLTRLYLPEAMQIKLQTGLGLREFTNGLLNMESPEAIASAVWLAKKRRGDDVGDILDQDFDLLEFAGALDVQKSADEDAPAVEDEGAAVE